MCAHGRRCCLIIAAVLLSVAGCKPKPNPPAEPPGATTPPDNAAAVAALTRGMKQIPPTSLSQSHVGMSCVVVARAPEGGTRVAPPPPPMGMVYIMGPTTVYKGKLHALSADKVEMEAPYPTSSNVKVVPIPRAEIQSVHLAP